MIRKTSIAAALIGMAALAAHGSASAESIPQDAINLSNAKLSLPEAVSLAEKHHPGSKANQAELKFKKERLYYEVEVVTPQERGVRCEGGRQGRHGLPEQARQP